MSRTDELKVEATRAREELVASVGVLGATVDDAKAAAVGKAKRAAPIAAGIAGALILLKLIRR